MKSKFSALVWSETKPIFQKILQHPFNKELANGNLSQSRFLYYIEQDAVYLKHFAKSLLLLASRAESTDMTRSFIEYAKGALIAEQDIVHRVFLQRYAHRPTQNTSPACLSYSSFLTSSCALQSIEIGVAAILPCFWIYGELAKVLKEKAVAGNVYQEWIDSYASDGFDASVQHVIDVFDRYADSATSGMRKEMMDVYRKSALLEWHFWNDAYHMQTIELSYDCY